MSIKDKFAVEQRARNQGLRPGSKEYDNYVRQTVNTIEQRRQAKRKKIK